MMTTTLPPGGEKPRFFLMFPTTWDFLPEKAYLSFSLPAGKSFPSDLTKLMEKVERYISFEDSGIEGVEFQKCEGTNCACANCRQQLIVCEGRACSGFVSSTDGIQCSSTNCIPTNNAEYSMYPLYPDFMLAYSPKFRFMHYVRGGTTTPMPSAGTAGGDHVLFSVVFPSSDVFDTNEKFRELKVAVDALAPTSNQYEMHNTATLQRVIKKNKLSRDLMSGQKTKPQSSIKPIIKTTKPPGTIRTRAPATRMIGSNILTPSMRPIIMERYEDELVLADLVVPETENTDTDNTPVELLTPEQNFTTTAPPSDNGLTMTQIWMIVGGCVVALFVLGFVIMMLSARRNVSASQTTTSKKKKTK